MDDLPKEQWDQNQPKPWQWVLIVGVIITILCGVSTSIIFAYQTYNNWMVARNQNSIQTAATATTVQPKQFEIFEDAKTWQIMMLDTFDGNKNEWMEGDIDDQYTRMTLTLDGKYIWNAVAKRDFIWRIWPESNALRNFYLAVDAQNATANDDAQYGLIFRNNDDSYIFLEIRDSGNFRILSHDDSGWDEMISSTQSDAIQPGEINHLEVISVDDTIFILINDKYVGSTIASSPTEGQVGLAIGLSNTGEKSTIIFDNFELRVP